MTRNAPLRSLLTGVLLAGLLPVAAAQSFQDGAARIPAGNPNNASYSESVDFGDVDLDGDLDALFADGGDCCNDQNRIWVNDGGSQGGTIGFFSDETATRFPAVLDDGRDIELVDFDADGDLDLYLSATSQIANQSNRWWTNMGGAQAGSAGFFADETAARWVGLGGAGSSIAPTLVLGVGGFIDHSCDCDFGDLDNDGDLDLLHSSYGGAFGGNAPTRIFLNDGVGQFSEHNPSGFQLSGQNIANGNPALWAEGTQQAGTSNTSGANADVASSALDVDLGDVDGDWDLDILHGARQEKPRLFKNRLSETGTLIWRDVSAAAYPPAYTSGNGHYEQELGDFDNDDDLDVYGLNWFNNFTDETLVNDGTGTFGSLTLVSGSQQDDNEVDFGDYDNDGDLDVFVANFSGQDRLYKNQLMESGSFSLSDVTMAEIPPSLQSALDGEWGDLDADGDYDVMVANDAGQPNKLLENTTQAADTRAPRAVALEQAPDRAASAVPSVVRVHVYDNAAYYLTYFAPVELEYRVGAGPWSSAAMLSAGGQVFRGEVPGLLVGAIDYRVRATDAYGNQSVSQTRSYSATGSGCNGSPSAYCTSKATSLAGCVPTISFSGVPSASAGGGFQVLAGPTPGGANPGLFIYTTHGAAAVPAQNPFGFLCLDTSGGLFRIALQTGGGSQGACDGGYAVDFNAYFATQTQDPLLVQGAQVDIQCWYRDPPNTGTANLTNAGRFTICP